ncbi:MAG: transcriptional coactivator p15/PC4 family protein [Elusimicrobiota bacterium]|nr:MAG: transcriptional coactivator p15/PC4 family protein [Elusimicrobiota bacterium]
MPEKIEFKPLKDLGAVVLNETSELKFYVDEFKGHRYGSIRTFIKGDGYTGPTKAGVTLNARVLDEAIAAIEKLPRSPSTSRTGSSSASRRRPASSWSCA